jgi:hypothetical protein
MTERLRPLARTGADIGSAALTVELDTERKLRTRNKLHYRFNHWPIWIFVFFIAPGPVTFSNLARCGLLPRTRPIVPGELAVSDGPTPWRRPATL